MQKFLRERGITLIALIVTIVILMILTAVSMAMLLGENGIIKQAQNGAKSMEEAEAKEKLEIALIDLQTEKVVNSKYNQNEFIDKYLIDKKMQVMEDLVIVDEWQFTIDRNVPKIIQSLGKGTVNKEIKIVLVEEMAPNYAETTIKIEVIYAGEIESIGVNGKTFTKPSKVEGKYIINEKVEKNGIYSVYARDTQGGYQIATIEIKNIAENIDIYTVDDLIKFRERVNSGATYEGKTIKLMNNISLKDVCGEGKESWEPISKYEEGKTNYFKGTFDGQNYSIDDLYINNNNNSNLCVALFGHINGGSVKNLNISGQVISNSNVNTALLVGYMKGGKIENIHTKDTSEVRGNSQVGGICGYAEENIIIKKCSNRAKINGMDFAAGGIIGNITDGNIESCFNYAEVTNSDRFTGGITGGCTRSNITKSANSGNITSLGTCGGIVGLVGISGDITFCYNTGKVTGTGDDGGGKFSSVGGISGVYGEISYCYNMGDIYGKLGMVAGICGNSEGKTVSYCYNVGNIINNGRYIGPIVGYDNKSYLDNCYWTTDLPGNEGENITNCSKLTVEQLKEYTNQYFVQDKDGKINNGFPILFWQANKM